MLEIQLLGGFVVWQDGQPVQPFRTQKVRALLVYLALQPDRAHPRAVLADLLWPDAPPERAAHNLRQALTFLRQGLKQGNAAASLTITRQSVRLSPGPALQIDSLSLAQLLAQADLNSLAQAVALYRGPLLDGFYLDDAPEFETWLLAERERWQATVLATLNQLADFHRTRGEYGLARDYLQRALALDPWHEQAYRELMRLLALQGDVTGALAQFAKARHALQAGLGVEPLPETQALAEQIKQGTFPTTPVTDAALTFQFVGRGAEHARLAAAFTTSPRPRLTLLEGVLGIGKTRLMTEFGRYAASHGAICLEGRCLAYAVPVPYQPLVMALRVAWPHLRQPLAPIWLAELARLLPELTNQFPNLPPLPPDGDSNERQRLFTAIAHCLDAVGRPDQPLLLLWDDLHWADTASLDVLQFLLHQPLSRLLIIGTVRPEDTPADHPLTRLRRGLSRERLVEVISLSPLDERMVQAMVAYWVEPGDAAAFAAVLYQGSEGNPFVLSELLYDLAETLALGPGLWRLPDDWRKHVPHLTPGLRDVVLDRVERLPPASLRVLQIAAIIGQTCDTTLLDEVAGQATGDWRQEWQTRHLVHSEDQSPHHVVFSHDKIRAVVYESIPIAQRQAWHGAVAQACQQRGDSAAATLAHHFYHSPDPAQALPYLLQAAQEASHALALAETITLCTQALALSPVSPTMHYELLRQRQRAYQFLGDTEGEGRDAAALVNVAQQSGDPRQLADAVQRLGRFYYLRGQVDEARQVITEIANVARASGQAEVVVRVLNMLAMLLRETVAGQAEALLLQAEALAMARAAAQPVFAALLLCDTGVILAEKGDFAAAVSHVQEGLALLRAEGAQGYLPHALYILGGLWREIGQFEAAQNTLAEALALCQKAGVGTYLMAVFLERGRLALIRDRLAEARQSYIQVQQLAEQAGRPLIVGKAQLGLGWVAYLEGEFALAQTHLEQAIGLCGREEVTTRLLAQALLGLAFVGLGRVAEAVQVIEEGMTIAAAGERVLGARPQLYWSYYRILHAAGRLSQAQHWLRTGYDLLLAQSATLPEPWRGTFLTAIPIHQQIIRLVHHTPGNV